MEGGDEASHRRLDDPEGQRLSRDHKEEQFWEVCLRVATSEEESCRGSLLLEASWLTVFRVQV